MFFWERFLVFYCSVFFVLASASMGLLARTAGADFSAIIFQQIIFGLVGCIGLYFFAFKVDYKILRRFAFPLLFSGWPFLLWSFCPMSVSATAEPADG